MPPAGHASHQPSQRIDEEAKTLTWDHTEGQPPALWPWGEGLSGPLWAPVRCSWHEQVSPGSHKLPIVNPGAPGSSGQEQT